MDQQADRGSPPHHRPGGFQNSSNEFVSKSLGEVLRWRWDALRHGLPPPSVDPTPRVAPALDFLQRNTGHGNAQPTVTWLGHATVLAQLGGLSVLTDPMFSERASPLSFAGPRRHVALPMKPAQLPRIDVVLVSHNHYDHLDLPSVRALAAQPGGAPAFIVPLRLGRWLAGQGIGGAIELDWWQSHRVAGPRGPVEVLLTPAQHWSGRGLRDRMATLWGGFAVLADDCHLFFAGDTGYSRDFADLRAHLAERQRPADGGGFDIALLPIGAYEPRWFMRNQHVNPAEAVKIHRDIGAKRSLGVHWGTFALTDEALDEPPRVWAHEAAAAGLSPSDCFVTAVGETRLIARRVGGGGGGRGNGVSRDGTEPPADRG